MADQSSSSFNTVPESTSSTSASKGLEGQHNSEQRSLRKEGREEKRSWSDYCH